MTTMAGAEPVQTRSPELGAFIWFSHMDAEAQALGHLPLLCQTHLTHLSIGTGVEQLGHKPAHLWDAGAIGRGLAYYATASAPTMIFS